MVVMYYDFAKTIGNLKSFLTCIVYLNDVSKGGETNFFDDANLLKYSVKPLKGTALFFVHGMKNLHECSMIPINSTESKYVKERMCCIKSPNKDPT
ncbi:hypothetical protein AKO1_001312 [Acrasis kona]|uniref:Prolyl 4-hydroxylase alpha subunit Fe(2+) 2OG dioxygenase domain-containing protein n=1 Tax=Acrasis kona TaxID=1008807 RepID=A0AAW2ZEF5_9EUKA